MFVCLRGQLPATGRAGCSYDSYGSFCISLPLSLSLSLFISLFLVIEYGLDYTDWLVGWQDPVLTQPDTLMMIEHKEYMGVQVPIYHFKQSGRINPNQLPFRLGTSALIRPISRLIGSFNFPRLIVCRNNSPNQPGGSDWSSRRACGRTIRE